MAFSRLFPYGSENQQIELDSHPIRTLYPNKIIVSNKLLGLSRLGLGQGSFYMHEMTIPVTIGIIKRCNQ